MNARSQSTISIEYVNIPANLFSDSTLNVYLKDPGPADLRMVFNDSFAFSHFLPEQDRRLYKRAVIGNKLIHHATFSNFLTGETFSESTLTKKKTYLIRFDSSWINSWQPVDGEKTILNYRCKAVRAVRKDSREITVWYTNDLKFKQGFLFYPGVPGVVLEVYDYRSGGEGRYIRAISLKESDQKLAAPVNAKIVTFEEATRK